MILTPDKLSTEQLEKTIEQAKNRFGPRMPDHLKPVLAEAEAELARRRSKPE